MGFLHHPYKMGFLHHPYKLGFLPHLYERGFLSHLKIMGDSAASYSVCFLSGADPENIEPGGATV